jgi:hypothetical protein
VSQINRAANPSFETDTTGWSTSGAAGGMVRTAGTWGVGAWYGRMQASTTATQMRALFGNVAHVIPVSAGDRVFGSVRLRADNVGAEGVRAWLEAQYRDSGGGTLATVTGPIAFLGSAAQTLYLFSATGAPINTVNVLINIRTEASDIVAGDQIGIDALNIRINEQPDAYFDGDSANAGWLGTAHASQSERVAVEVFANPKNWKSGAVRIEGKIYRCDENGIRLDDLSRYIKFGRVTWNEDKGAGQKLAGEFRFNRRGLLRTYVDFLAPVLRLEWRDGTVDEKQFGLFLCDFPDDNIYQIHAEQGVKGLDPTWFPYNSAVRDTINYASGDLVATEMRDLMVAVWPRVIVPSSARTFGAAKSLYPGRRRYTEAAAQLESMGWYHPYPDLDGNIRTMPYVDMSRVTPAITIDYEDFVGEWQVRPSLTTLANVVSVYKENVSGSGTPIGSVAVNSDPGSPISTAYRPEILRELTNSNIQTQAEADALTLQMLQESASYYRVISGKLSPGVWMEPYAAADTYLQHDVWGNLAGRYSVRVWQVNFTQSDAEVDVEMNRRVVFGSSEDV